MEVRLRFTPHDKEIISVTKSTQDEQLDNTSLSVTDQFLQISSKFGWKKGFCPISTKKELKVFLYLPHSLRRSSMSLNLPKMNN